MPTERQLRNFWDKVRVNPETGCQEWIGGSNNQGYGRAWVDGKLQAAHRVAFAIYHGQFPDDAHICHTCDNPKCVRKEHLFLGTAQLNSDDKFAKKRDRVTRHSTEAVARVHALRAAGWLQTWIARELGMSQPHVSEILRGVQRANG